MTASVTKVNTVKRLISALLVLLLLAGMIIPVLGSVGTDAYVNDDEINVRTGPGTGYGTVLFNGSKSIRLYRGQYVRVIAVQRGSDGYDWYQIVFVYKGYTKVGYMRSDFVSYIGDDRAYRKYLDEQGFPKSYQPYLRALYAASGGKWTFVAYKTGLDWTKSLENESTLGRALLHWSYDTAQRSTAPGAYDSSTGEWRQFEPGWYAASRETVAYYMDPRSYLTDGTCIAFEKLSGGESVTHEQIKKVLAKCVWATDEIIDEFIKAGSKEELEKQKQADIQRLRSEGNTSAANALEKVTVTGVSPIFLAVKARDEIGTGATQNATGYPLSDGKKYYNFFNVGAYGDDPNYNGILYAQSKGWDTSYKALLGGAWFIFRNYIEDGKDTTFLQRFNFTPLYTYSYQYATDITYAYLSGGWNIYQAYVKNGLADTELTFSVPILENMPAVTKLPTARYEDEYVDPEPEPEPDPEPNPNPNPEPDPGPSGSYDYVNELNLRLTDSYLSGFTLGTPVKSLISQIKSVNKNATVTVTARGAAVADSALVATGQVLTIQDAAGTYTYTCVVYGDANGDGRIAATDLLAVKKHILGTQTLSGAYARAAQLSGSKIAATSLLAIKKHILGAAPIVQK